MMFRQNFTMNSSIPPYPTCNRPVRSFASWAMSPRTWTSDYDVPRSDHRETPRVEYPLYVYDTSLPSSLLEMFQLFFCKLCNFQFAERHTGKLHYESRVHLKEVRKYLIAYAQDNGTPLHPMAHTKASTSTSASTDKVDSDGAYFSRCEPCKVDLNSEAQAKDHYQGKLHKKKAGNTSDETPKPDTKKDEEDDEEELVPEPCNLEEFGLPSAFASKQIQVKEAFRCDLCNVTATSEEHMLDHMSGARHRKMEDAQKAKSLTTATATSSPNQTDRNTVKNPDLYCEICKIYVTSDENMADHLRGLKHKKKAQAAGIIEFSEPDVAQFVCKTCDVSTNSSSQHEQHLLSKKHKQNVDAESAPYFVEDVDIQDHFQQYVQSNTALNTDLWANEDLQKKRKNKSDFAEPSNKMMRCDLCDLSLTSQRQFDMHLAGFRHEHNRRKILGEDSIRNGAISDEDAKNLYCHLCGSRCQTFEQLANHFASKKHLNNLNNNAGGF